MNTPVSPPPAQPPVRRGPSRLKLVFWLLIVPLALAAGYFFFVLKWNYSNGERAGWVQKFSRKGWLCKTWEGEMAMVSMPGSTPEKFLFTVWEDGVAEQINRVMGKRVTLHYEEKVGLPTTCFGETRHYVTAVAAVDEIPLAPGIVVPAPGHTPAAPAAPPAAPPPAAGPATAPSPAPAPPATSAPATSAPPPAPPPAATGK